jgi:hypothetical protein
MRCVVRAALPFSRIAAIVAGSALANGDHVKTRIGSMRALVRLALPTLAILATFSCATTSGKAGAASLPVVVDAAPPGCQNLGKVSGTHQDSRSPDMEWAKKDALEKAQALGATHVVPLGSNMYTYVAAYAVMALRCPAPAAPAKGT